MYQSIEQITDFLPNVPDFVTHALGQPKLVFGLNFLFSIPDFIKSNEKPKWFLGFWIQRGRFWGGWLVIVLREKWLSCWWKLVIMIGEENDAGPIQSCRTAAELRSWDEAKGNWLWAGFSPSITWPTDLENLLLYTWNLRPTPPIKKSTSGPTLKGN